MDEIDDIFNLGNAKPLIDFKKRSERKSASNTVVDNMDHITFDPEVQKEIDDIVENGASKYITGVAGSGKSTMVSRIVHDLRKKGKNVVILAPSGVAAVNIGGQTIHSFFKFPPKPISYRTVPTPIPGYEKQYTKVDVFIIDEISQVRADLLDGIHWFYVKNFHSTDPFGGKQMIFVGDLMQLPPVLGTDAEKEMFAQQYKSEFFFDASVMEKFHYKKVILEKVHRQKDPIFLEFLNKVRNNEITEEEIEKFHEVTYKSGRTNPNAITLSTMNRMADQMNQVSLSMVPGELVEKKATITGYFDPKTTRAPEYLQLKKGCKVMTILNDPEGRYFNGSIGEVVEIYENEIIIKIKGEEVTISRKEFENIKFNYDRLEQKMTYQSVGTFTQFPLVLAYGISVHKSQGMTFEEVNLDIGGTSFAHGQAYVALSRCKSMEGINMITKLRRSDIKVDPKVLNYFKSENLKLDI